MALDPMSNPMLRCLCLALSAALAIQLFLAASAPAAAGPILEPWDKVAHLAVYSVITGLAWFGTAGRMPLSVIAAGIVLGALDELHQGSVPGRVADAADFLVDACAAAGTGLGLLLCDARRQAAGARRRASRACEEHPAGGGR